MGIRIVWVAKRYNFYITRQPDDDGLKHLKPLMKNILSRLL